MFADGFDMLAPFPPRVGLESIEKKGGKSLSNDINRAHEFQSIHFFLPVFPNKGQFRTYYRVHDTNHTMPENAATALTAKLRTMRLH